MCHKDCHSIGVRTRSSGSRPNGRYICTRLLLGHTNHGYCNLQRARNLINKINFNKLNPKVPQRALTLITGRAEVIGSTGRARCITSPATTAITCSFGTASTMATAGSSSNAIYTKIKIINYCVKCKNLRMSQEDP